MKRAFLSILALAVAVPSVSPAYGQLFGPGKFKVEQVDDRFEASGSTTYVGKNNRISKKSVVGGVHIDAKGVFVEPLAIRRKSDGALESIAFYIHNETGFDTAYGSPNRIGTPQRITFLPNSGAPISLVVTNGGSKWGDRVSYNTVSRSASTDIRESGFADLSVDQFRRIASATTLAVKIQGSERSVVYNERDIAKTFLTNLRVFDAAALGPDGNVPR